MKTRLLPWLVVLLLPATSNAQTPSSAICTFERVATVQADEHGKIATGTDPDIPVRANDVIDVPYSDLRIGPYVMYNVLTRMAIPLPAF